MLRVVFLLCTIPNFGWTLQCMRCQNGYHAPTPCTIPRKSEACLEPNAQCFTVVEWFQNGALQLVRRGCWAPSNNSRPGGFCNNYDKKTGQVKTCENCTTDNCNGRTVYQPRLNRCTSYY